MKLYTEEQLIQFAKDLLKEENGGKPFPSDEYIDEYVRKLVPETKLTLNDTSYHGKLKALLKKEDVKIIPMKVDIKGHDLLEIGKGELLSRYEDYLTVGKLKEYFEEHNIKDDVRVLIERVEDFYYENNHWSVYRHGGYWYYSGLRMNEKVDSGEFNDKTKYPKIIDPQKLKMSEEDLHKSKSQYTPAFCCFDSDEDPEFLFINLHY